MRPRPTSHNTTVDDKGCSDVIRAAQVAHDVAAAIQALHDDHKVLHRDITPNVGGSLGAWRSGICVCSAASHSLHHVTVPPNLHQQ